MKQLTMCVDMGASMTKYGIVEPSVGNLSFPNNMIVRDTPSGTYKLSDSRYDNFEMCVTCPEQDKSGTPLEGILGKCVSFGKYAARSKETAIRPSVDNKKCTQAINYASVLASIAYEVERGNLWGKIKVLLAVPPVEIEQAKQAFQALVGVYKVTLVGGGRLADDEQTFEITEVGCYEESMLTCTSFLFSKRGPKHPELLGKTLLVFDIGASTTDVGIVKKGVYWDKSQQTLRIGGNMIRDIIKDALYEKYEVLLEGEELEDVITLGKVEICGEEYSIVDLLNEAREHCAAEIREQMSTYFKRTGTDVKTIGAVVLSGGGSLSSGAGNGEDDTMDKDTQSVGSFICEALGLKGFYYGEEARYANVEGLVLRALLAEKN